MELKKQYVKETKNIPVKLSTEFEEKVYTNEYVEWLESKVKNNVALDSAVRRSEQLKCQCKKAQFTRNVDFDFNPLCGRCGKAL